MELVIPISYSLLFGHKPKSFSYYLNGIDRSTLVKIALLLIYSKDRFSSFDDFASNFFSRKNDRYVRVIYKLYQQLNTYEEPSPLPKSYAVSNQHTGLELLKHCFSIKPTVNIQTEQEIERNIFKVILAINEELTSINISDEQEESEMQLAATTMVTMLAYYDFNSDSLDRKFICQLVKAYELLKFCATNSKFKPHLTLFLEKHQCHTYIEYMERFIPLILSIRDAPKNEIYPIIKINPKDNENEEIVRFLNAISIGINDIVEQNCNVDFRSFRASPLIRISKYEYYVVNPSFCAERVYNSILFEFKNINNILQEEHKIKDVFVEYTTSFSEKYLFYNIIRHIANKACISKSGDELNKIAKGEPDYYVRSGNKVFLFEYKDARISADVKVSRSYKTIKDHIHKKFVTKTSSKGTGIRQLASHIERINNRNFVWDKSLKCHNAQIYPILVIHDPIYSIAGLNFLLNNWFKDFLPINIDVKKVNKLLVIDLDTLIWYSGDLTGKITELEDRIKEYYSFLDKKAPYDSSIENRFSNLCHIYYSVSTFWEENYNMINKDQNIIYSIITDMRKHLPHIAQD